MNPHMSMVALDPPHTPNRRWQCTYCGLSGSFDQLREMECTHVYPPCKHCGQTPECAIDCPGIMAALGLSSVHVVTDDPKMQALVDRAKKKEGRA